MATDSAAVMGNPTAMLEDFRYAMRRVASGVALVTTGTPDGRRYGIAMTAFMSLSFEPPSLVMAVNRSASIYKPLLDMGRFCVNVLAEGQAPLCKDFVARPSADRFGAGEWSTSPDGVPYLPDAQANIFCALASHQSSGTHEIIIGVVESALNRDAVEPLVFVNGSYGGFS